VHPDDQHDTLDASEACGYRLVIEGCVTQLDPDSPAAQATGGMTQAPDVQVYAGELPTASHLPADSHAMPLSQLLGGAPEMR
jgi:hypothetical protein